MLDDLIGHIVCADCLDILKQLPKIENATLFDIFNQRTKLYNEEKCSNAVILGIEFAMIWKTIDEFIKQTNKIFATITKGGDNE